VSIIVIASVVVVAGVVLLGAAIWLIDRGAGGA